MRLTSPDVDVDADLLDRRTSVDLQEALSVHFDEASSFDLLKDKILFPENDSLDGDLDIDMAGVPAAKVLEDGDQGDIFVMPIADANAESGSEVDCVGLLEERLRDINIMEEDGVLQNKNGDRDIGTATPPAQFSSYNVPSQLFILSMSNPDLRRNIHCSPAGTRTPVPSPKEQ